MFSITPKNHLPKDVRLIASGALFGRWGTPIDFELISEVVKEPFSFTLEVLSGETLDYKEGEIQGMALKNKITIASKTSPSFSKGRCPVIYLDKHNIELTFSFAVHPYPDAEFFTFVYEFYEEPMSPREPGQKEVVV